MMFAVMKRLFLACVLASGLFDGDFHAAAQSDPPPFSECAGLIDERALRVEIERSAGAAMSEAARNLDYETIVSDSWRAARFDRRFERIVEAKIEILRAESSYVGRLVDANVPAYAEEVAERVAELVFGSPEFAELQESLMAEIGKRLEPAVADVELAVGGQAAECVRVYLGARYADIIRVAFADKLSTEVRVDVETDSSGVGTTAAISLSGVIASILVLAFRRAVQRIIAALVQRLAGAIAARLAAWASIITGVIVLSYELIAGADGIFPEIRDTLVSAETKTEIQRAITEELQSVGVEAFDGRAAMVADAMIARWTAFKSNHERVLDLAEDEEDFAEFLSGQAPQQFEKLSALVALLTEEAAKGGGSVVAAVRSGLLARAMRIPKLEGVAERLAPQGVTISELVAWADLAGALYPKVIEFGLPVLLDPSDLTAEQLQALLKLDTPSQAQKLAELSRELRSVALGLQERQLRALARDYPTEAIEALITVIRAAPNPQAQQSLLAQAIANPEAAQTLADPATARLVTSSGSPAAALDVLLDPASKWNPGAFFEHVSSVAVGEVAPMLIVHRYGWATAALLGVPALLGIGLMRSVGQVIGVGGRRRHRSSDRSALLDD